MTGPELEVVVEKIVSQARNLGYFAWIEPFAEFLFRTANAVSLSGLRDDDQVLALYSEARTYLRKLNFTPERIAQVLGV